ncbi:hypothetical protein BDF14DRAFT_1914363 [Spinellus fusiger]|nr:hypothetical protein BDF14DRAFT_1914363 [Spinellus fusiger]
MRYTSLITLACSLLASSAIAAPLDSLLPLDGIFNSIDSILSLNTIKAKAVKFPEVHLECTVPGTFALTFDDGPYEFSWDLATHLNKQNITATFFINGLNYVNVAKDSVKTSEGKKTYLQVVKHYMDMGHQVGSHTFTHKVLTGLTASAIKEEMVNLENVVYKATGKKPAYMRPPTGDYDKNALKVLGQLGYTVINWDIDSNDWKTHNLKSEQKEYGSVMGKETGQPKTGHIALNHEVYNQTVTELVPWAIEYVKSKNYRFATVAECLGNSLSSAYK